MKRVSSAMMPMPSVLLLGACAVALAMSCANSDDGAGGPQEDTSVALDASGPDDAGPPDATCNAADAECTTDIPPCDAVEWCMVETPASPFYVLKAIWGSGPNDVWAAGSGGTIVHYDGSAWVATPSGIHNTFNAVWGSGPDDVYVVSGSNAVLHSDGFKGAGTAWTNMPLPLDSSTTTVINAVWGTSARDVRLGASAYFGQNPFTGDYGFWNQFERVLDDAGATPFRPIAGDGTVRGIWGASADDLWLIVDDSSNAAWKVAVTLHGTAAAGSDLVFEEVDSQSSDALVAISGSSASDVWTVGSHGAIRHITPSDTRWQVVPSPTTASLHAVWARAPDDVWAAGESGTILHYDGKSFVTSTAQLPSGQKPALYGIWGSGPNDVWIVGDAIVLHYTGPKAPGGAK